MADEQKPEQKPDGRTTTELRVLITEDAHGKLDVEWQTLAKGTEISVPMRPAHIIGQLQTAILIIAAQSYEGLKSKFAKVGIEGNSISGRKSEK